MTIFLGVDGGGSTCRARAVDEAGKVLGEGLAGPANITSDLDGACRAILSACAAALGPIPLSQVCAGLGLAGANDPVAAMAVQDRLTFRASRVVSDGHISVLGALGSGDGIVAAIGTGSVFVRQSGGAQLEIGGRGLVLGDEASGAWIGRRLLSRALRGHDGMEAMTPLCRKVIADLGGVSAVVTFAKGARPADVAGYASLVIGASDPAAAEIQEAAAAECLRAVAVLQADRNLPVVCLGGLASFFAPILQRRWTVLAPRGTAIDGAVELARSLDG